MNKSKLIWLDKDPYTAAARTHGVESCTCPGLHTLTGLSGGRRAETHLQWCFNEFDTLIIADRASGQQEAPEEENVDRSLGRLIGH